MPVAVVFLLRAVVLILLWGFVIAAVVAVRHDIFGTKPRAAPTRPPAGPRNRAAPRSPPQGKRRGPPTHVAVVDGPLAGTSVALSSLPVTIGRADELDDRAPRRLRLEQPRPAGPQRPGLAGRGPRIHQRHLPRRRKVTAPVVVPVGSPDPDRHATSWSSGMTRAAVRRPSRRRPGAPRQRGLAVRRPRLVASPTASAVRSPARSPAGSRSPRLPLDTDPRSPIRTPPCASAVRRRRRRAPRRDRRAHRAHRHGHDADRDPRRPTTGSASRTSATPGPTCSAAVSCADHPRPHPRPVARR